MSDPSGPWKQKQMFAVTSALYFVYWLIYCFHLIGVWHGMSRGLHFDSAIFAISSLGLWSLLLEEKVSGYAMLTACFFFISASRLATHVFAR